jgi:hypothetical protein
MSHAVLVTGAADGQQGRPVASSQRFCSSKEYRFEHSSGTSMHGQTHCTNRRWKSSSKRIFSSSTLRTSEFVLGTMLKDCSASTFCDETNLWEEA